MSKTDKTNPFWVQLKQNPQWSKERHSHFNGVCTLDYENNKCYGYWIPWLGKCKITARRGFRRQMWTTRFSWFHGHVAEFNGSARAKLRMARRDMLKMEREDLMDYDVENPRHRHNAIWENW